MLSHEASVAGFFVSYFAFSTRTFFTKRKA